MSESLFQRALDPIPNNEAQIMYHESTDKLLRAAYLRPFTSEEQDRCRKKFPLLKSWWSSLGERQQERVKGALAAEVLHVFRE